MLKHGRAGVPMEVMGLMLGEFVDDYTVRVIDVFAMPQSGTVSIHRFFSSKFMGIQVSNNSTVLQWSQRPMWAYVVTIRPSGVHKQMNLLL